MFGICEQAENFAPDGETLSIGGALRAVAGEKFRARGVGELRRWSKTSRCRSAMPHRRTKALRSRSVEVRRRTTGPRHRLIRPRPARKRSRKSGEGLMPADHSPRALRLALRTGQAKRGEAKSMGNRRYRPFDFGPAGLRSGRTGDVGEIVAARCL